MIDVREKDKEKRRNPGNITLFIYPYTCNFVYIKRAERSNQWQCKKFKNKMLLW